MYTNLMRHTKRIQTNNNEKMIKTIPIRVSASLADEIKRFAKKYEISQQDAIRLAIQKGLKHISEFIDEERTPTNE